MKKKFRSIGLIVLVLVLLFTACGGGDEITSPDNVQSDTPQMTNEKITLAETEIYNKDGIIIKVTGLEDSWVGTEVKVLVENNSADNILVTARYVSINGYMMPTASMYMEVASSKKANGELSFYASELSEANIEKISDIEFYVEISDNATWQTLDTSDLITLTTSAVDYVQPIDDSGDVLFEKKDIKVISKGLKKDMIWDGAVVFYIENNSNTTVSVYAENVSVNGFMVDAGLWSDLRPATRMVDGMYLLDLEELAIENIDEIENIEFNLRIVNAKNWNDIAKSDVITLNFK
ncbi:MAG: hypothetical protein IJD81_10335 [Oscillospiraceae bacterium]|nr:hypothetical protein [Oscillospiraceae bacterium]